MGETIYTKLGKIQAQLKAPKSQYNEFGKYNYRNAEDILNAVKPLCQAYDVVLILTDEIKNVGDRYYVQATARLIDINTGAGTDVTAYAREEESKKGMDGSQVTGASSSYARKYALNGLFAIDDTKDCDTTNKVETETATPDLVEIAKDVGVNFERVIAWYNQKNKTAIKDPTELPYDTLSKAIAKCRSAALTKEASEAFPQ